MTNGETQTDKQSVNQGNWSLSIKCRLEGFVIVVGIMYTICHGSNIFTLRLQSTRLLTVSIYLDVYELPQQSSFTILHDAFKPVTHKYFTKTKLGLAEDNLQNFTQRLLAAACCHLSSKLCIRTLRRNYRHREEAHDTSKRLYDNLLSLITVTRCIKISLL